MAVKTVAMLSKFLKETMEKWESEIKHDSIVDLDEYCLLHIFSYITNIRERIRLKRVCKRFADVITDGLKTDFMCFTVNNLLYPSELNDPGKKESIRFDKNVLFGSVSRLYEVHNEIFNYTFDDPEGFLDLPTAPLATVAKLVIKSRHARRLDEGTDYSNWAMTIMEADLAEFKWLLKHCPKIKSLHIHGLHLDSYDLKHIPNRIEYLQLINTTIEISELTKFFKSNCLRLLGLVYCRHTVIPLDSDKVIISSIAEGCPRLRRLRIQLSYRDLDNFERFENLGYLSIEGCGRSKAFYDQVLRNCPNLLECKFTFQTLPTKELSDQWYKEFPNLKKIEFEVEEALPLAICAPPANS